MEIKKKYIDKLLRECSQFSHWVDHLSLNLKTKIPKLSNILSVLDLDNSNFKIEIIDGYPINYTKSISRTWTFINISVSIRDVPFTIFQYLEYSEKRKKILKTEWCFTFYSTYFRLLERWDLDLSFEKVFFGDYYNNIKLYPISRIDYRLDFFFEGDCKIPKRESIVGYRKDINWTLYTTDKLIEWKNIEINSIHMKKWVITWWDLWSRSNKSVYLRLYDKLLDSKIKWKVALYDDYFLFKNVFRLEWEFRCKFNKKLFKNIIPRSFNYWELSELESKCMDYFWFTSDKQKKYIYQYKQNKNKDDIDYRYLRDFWGRACKLALMWHNPFNIILYQFLRRESIKEQIKKELLENLLLDFEQHKKSLIKQKILFSYYDNRNGDNSIED